MRITTLIAAAAAAASIVSMSLATDTMAAQKRNLPGCYPAGALHQAGGNECLCPNDTRRRLVDAGHFRCIPRTSQTGPYGGRP